MSKLANVIIKKDNYPYVNVKRDIKQQIENLTNLSYYYQDIGIIGETKEDMLLDQLVTAVDNLKYYYKNKLKED